MPDALTALDQSGEHVPIPLVLGVFVSTADRAMLASRDRSVAGVAGDLERRLFATRPSVTLARPHVMTGFARRFQTRSHRQRFPKDIRI